MFISDALRVLWRRWYVVVAGLLLTAVGVVGVTQFVPPTYEASRAVLLLYPTTADGLKGNPYLSLPLGATGEIVNRLLTAPESRRAIKALGHSSEYESSLSIDGTPTVEIVARGPDERDVVATTDDVVVLLRTRLRALQELSGAKKSTFVTATPLLDPPRPEVLHGSQVRAAAGLLLLGLAGTLAAAFLMESLLARRAARVPRVLLAPPDNDEWSGWTTPEWEEKDPARRRLREVADPRSAQRRTGTGRHGR